MPLRLRAHTARLDNSRARESDGTSTPTAKPASAITGRIQSNAIVANRRMASGPLQSSAATGRSIVSAGGDMMGNPPAHVSAVGNATSSPQWGHWPVVSANSREMLDTIPHRGQRKAILSGGSDMAGASTVSVQGPATAQGTANGPPHFATATAPQHLQRVYVALLPTSTVPARSREYHAKQPTPKPRCSITPPTHELTSPKRKGDERRTRIYEPQAWKWRAIDASLRAPSASAGMVERKRRTWTHHNSKHQGRDRYVRTRR